MEKLMNTQEAIRTTKWTIDPLHSEVLFKIKHLVISTVTGSFTKFEGQVNTTGEDFENAQISFSIDVSSIHTGQEQRDAHLKNSDFFEIEKYPAISFTSTSFIKTGDNQYILTGELTMRGTTKEITLDVEYGGTEKDHYGNTKAGFELSGVVNRKEFGLTFNSLTESGGLALGENVKIAANIQLAQQA
jgi:polyisoprenoid-binding protein YceI